MRASLTSRLRPLLAALLLLTMAAACGGDDVASATSASPAAAGPTGAPSATEAAVVPADAFPVTITNRLGEVTIPARPERIVALGTNDVDTVLGLGLDLVGYAVNPFTGGLAPWLADQDPGDAVGLSLGAEIPYEAIAALEPDLILASPFAQIDEAYPLLSEIAPVVADTDGVLTDTWQARTRKVGEAVGMPEEADALVAAAEAAIVDVAVGHPGLAGRSYTMSWLREPGLIAVMAAQDVTSELFGQIGLELTPTVLDLAANTAGGAGTGAASIGMEELETLEADVVLIAFNTPDEQAAFEADPLVQALPAVADGRYLGITLPVVGGFRAPTVLAMPWLFEQIEPALAAAAA